jgi:uncharacterized protein (DUF488 family)
MRLTMKHFTIGYEAATIGDFVETLTKNKIKLLIDIREVAISRKRGFAKTRLSLAMADADIGYLHLRALGDPKAGREAARRGEFEEFRMIYANHLKTAAARQGLRLLETEMLRQRSCLMCYEREPENCHRSIVASILKKRSKIDIVNLYVEGHSVDERTGINAAA